MEAQTPELTALRSMRNLQFSLYCMTHTESSAKMVPMPLLPRIYPIAELPQFALDTIPKETATSLNTAPHDDAETHGFYGMLNYICRLIGIAVNRLQKKTRIRCERSHFTGSQLSCLEKAFNVSQYADISTRYKLHMETGIPEAKIQCMVGHSKLPTLKFGIKI
ncbi:unnamed protein product [Bursaphelenchus xylophilus]|uniref:(pine wood nematode) hypothetical protein n=1 Tax=Bursaphelenchus xylophilus TaxID=6326 RepID=A0A1I7SHC4_BURXY|nr:unnamed protein product [Bursaphelenchus xylophilus]CAG9118979.1 unnamed protein product [Bursaphelenchus xylophilus]